MADPSPHGTEPYRQTAYPRIACGACGAPVQPDRASFSEQGERICARCEATETIERGDRRAASSLAGGGFASLAMGVTSVAFNPLFVGSALAIASGIGGLLVLRRHPQYRERLGVQYPLSIAASVLGILLGCLHPTLFLLGALVATAGL